ncbi:MAG: hypothetical protein Q9O24_11135 [Gammaproteobacteria bacterium]|nr:hypothetical protein [Gammaproteobacteria bacterium]
MKLFANPWLIVTATAFLLLYALTDAYFGHLFVSHALLLISIVLLMFNVHLQFKADRQRPNSKGDNEHNSVVHTALEEIANQCAFFKDELQQVQSIVSSASDNLTGSVSSLDNNNKNQQDILQKLVNNLRAIIVDTGSTVENNSDINTFPHQTEVIVESFIDTIIHLQKNNNTLQKQIDQVTLKFNAIQQLLHHDSSEIPLTEEVFKHKFYQINSTVKGIHSNINTIRSLLKELNQTDITIIKKAQLDVHSMWNKTSQFNQEISAYSHNLSQLGEEIQQHILNSVTSLQSEDVILQLTEHMVKRSQQMETALNSLQRLHQAAKK